LERGTRTLQKIILKKKGVIFGGERRSAKEKRSIHLQRGGARTRVFSKKGSFLAKNTEKKGKRKKETSSAWRERDLR